MRNPPLKAHKEEEQFPRIRIFFDRSGTLCSHTHTPERERERERDQREIRERSATHSLVWLKCVSLNRALKH